MLSSAGEVAGVVVSKLDAVKVAELTGDIPQNVNFAVKASILRSLLDSSGVNYSDGVRGTALPNTEIAKRAQGFTVLVECWQ